MFPTNKSSQTPLKGQFSWHDGTLVFYYFTKAQATRFVGNGTLAGMMNFLDWLNEKNIPKNTNIRVIRRLYHRFTLESILNQNGIDMQSTTEPAMAKGNFRVLTSLNYFVLVPARKLFKRVAGGFYFKQTAR